MPVMVIGRKDEIQFVNQAAEQFFDMGAGLLLRHRLQDVVPPGSALIQVMAQARDRDGTVGERDVDLTTPRHGERLVDVTVTPFAGSAGVLLVILQERSFAHRLDRQLLHRGAVRSLHGMAAVLAHEIKNPLAGIRGAAQLLEDAASDQEKELTQLICQELDRISALIDRMEVFGDTRTLPRAPVNIHEVLNRVRKVASTSFARHVSFVEAFDPSLPAVLGDRDQLIQEHLDQLVTISQHRRKRRIERFDEIDVTGKARAGDFANAIEHFVNVHRCARQGAGVAEHFHPVDERADAIRFLADQLREFLLLVGRGIFEELRCAANSGQWIFDLMGEHCRHAMKRAYRAAVQQLPVQAMGKAAFLQDHEQDACAAGEWSHRDVDQALAMPRRRQIDVAFADGAVAVAGLRHDLDQRASRGHHILQPVP